MPGEEQHFVQNNIVNDAFRKHHHHRHCHHYRHRHRHHRHAISLLTISKSVWLYTFPWLCCKCRHGPFRFRRPKIYIYSYFVVLLSTNWNNELSALLPYIAVVVCLRLPCRQDHWVASYKSPKAALLFPLLLCSLWCMKIIVCVMVGVTPITSSHCHQYGELFEIMDM